MMVQHTSPFKRPPNIVLGRAPIDAGGAPQPADWASILQSNLEANADGVTGVIRVKEVRFNLRGRIHRPYAIKNANSRVRIHVEPDASSNTAEVSVWYMPETTPSLPYKPNYVDHSPSERQVFNYVSEMREMMDFIILHLKTETVYSNNTQSRILVSGDESLCGTFYIGQKKEHSGKPIFFYGQIESALRTHDGNWSITLSPMHGEGPTIVKTLDHDAVSFPPTQGAILVYASLHMAAVVVKTDFLRYYEVI